MRTFISRKGFTLVEMVLYVTICSIFLVSIATMVSFLLGSRVKSQAITEVNQQGIQVLTLVTRTLRNARSIQVPGVGATSSLMSVTTGYPLLDPTMFDISSSTFRITEGSGAPIPLTNSRIKISNLVFQNVSSSSSTEKIIRISFTANYNSQSAKSEYAYTKAFSGSATLR